MMVGIDESFDVCIFIGYYFGVICNGNLFFYIMDIDYDYFKINDEIVFEFIINVYIVVYYNVFVVFLSGDEMFCESVKKLNLNIVIVFVLKGIGNGLILIYLNFVLKKIEKGVKKVLFGDLFRYLIKLLDKFKIEIKFREYYKVFKVFFYLNMKKIDF